MKLRLIAASFVFAVSAHVAVALMPTADRAHNVSYNPDVSLNLDTSFNLFKDILEDYKERPSELFEPGQIKTYLSSPIAIKLRKDLGEFRDEMILKFYQERKKESPDYITLSQEITKKYVDWIRKYMKTVLPKGVSEKDFSIIAFGSMGRQEVAGPYTDLEAAILIKDRSPESMAKARKLAENMSFRFNQTGENPKLPMHIKGFRPDEEANFPFNFAMHAKGLKNGEAYCLAAKSLEPDAEKFYPFEGSFAFITSPKNLASYFNAARYDFPFPIVLNEKTKDSDWYKFSKQYLTQEMFQPNYIADELSRSSCAEQIGDTNDIANVSEKISDIMIKRELGVLSGFDSIGRNSFHLFGNSELFNTYEREAKKILDGPDNLRQKAMVRILHGLILKFRKDENGGQMFLFGKLSDPTDVKRILYRFEEQVWSTIARLYNLRAQNVREILEKLAALGIITKEFAKDRIDLLNNAIGIRWNETILAGEQLGPRQNYLSKETFNEALNELSDKLNDLEQQTWGEQSKFMESETLLLGLKDKIDQETDDTKKADLKRQEKELISNKKSSQKALNKIEDQTWETEKKISILKTLDPEAEDPAFPKTDIEKWRTKYSKLSQDLYRRVIYFVGGLKNIEDHNYVIANPDAFKEEEIKIPEFNVSRLRKIP